MGGSLLPVVLPGTRRLEIMPWESIARIKTILYSGLSCIRLIRPTFFAQLLIMFFLFSIWLLNLLGWVHFI